MEETEFYRSLVDRRVSLRYRGDAYLTGTCRSIDGYLNVIIEDGEYFEAPGTDAVRLVSCFVRGGALRHIEVLE